MEFSFFLFFFNLPTISFQGPCLGSPPPATFQETLTWDGNECLLSLSPFLCFASSSLGFGQWVTHGCPVSRSCWPHTERGRWGAQSLLRDDDGGGYSSSSDFQRVETATSFPVKHQSKRFSRANMIHFFFLKATLFHTGKESSY